MAHAPGPRLGNHANPVPVGPAGDPGLRRPAARRVRAVRRHGGGPDVQPCARRQPRSPPEVQGPGADSGGDGQQARPGQSATPVPPPQGCKDFDPSVIATCLDTVAAVAGLPGDGSTPSALAGERKSGRVLLATAGKDADRLREARRPGSRRRRPDRARALAVVRRGPARVRLCDDGHRQPRRALRQGPGGQAGAHRHPEGRDRQPRHISTDNRGALLLATGDAGNPNAAADPNSLAGKVLRIDTSGKAAAGNPNGALAVAAGLHAPGGVCASADGGRVWVTDRLADKDALYRVQAGQPLTAPAWTWTDKPGRCGLRRLRRGQRLGRRSACHWPETCRTCR